MVPALRIPDSTTLGTREPTYTDDDEGECEALRSGKENNLEDNGRDRCRPVPRPKRPRPRDGTVDDADYGNDVYSSSLSEVECIGLAKSSSTLVASKTTTARRKRATSSSGAAKKKAPAKRRRRTKKMGGVWEEILLPHAPSLDDGWRRRPIRGGDVDKPRSSVVRARTGDTLLLRNVGGGSIQFL
jgi:hypothetical protein